MILQGHPSAKKTLQPRVPSGGQTKTSPQCNARHVPKSGQTRRRLVESQGSNTRVCLDVVCITLRQKGASWLFIRSVRFIVSPRLQEKPRRGKMVLIAVEAVSAGIMSPAAGCVLIFASERHKTTPINN